MSTKQATNGTQPIKDASNPMGLGLERMMNHLAAYLQLILHDMHSVNGKAALARPLGSRQAVAGNDVKRQRYPSGRKSNRACGSS